MQLPHRADEDVLRDLFGLGSVTQTPLDNPQYRRPKLFDQPSVGFPVATLGSLDKLPHVLSIHLDHT